MRYDFVLIPKHFLCFFGYDQQVMLDNGGRPGTLKKIKKSNSSNLYNDPCRRPLPYEPANITDAYFYE